MHFRPKRDRGKLHLLVKTAALLPGQGRAGGQGPVERPSDSSAWDGHVLPEMRDGEDALAPHSGLEQEDAPGGLEDGAGSRCGMWEAGISPPCWAGRWAGCWASRAAGVRGSVGV